MRRKDYVAAVRFLREFTRSPADRGIYSLLIRATASSPAAATVLIRSELRTRPQRQSAAIAAAAAMAAEYDRASDQTGSRSASHAARREN